MRAYGSMEAGVRYLDLDEDYNWSRNCHKAVAIRRGKRDLKSKARKHNKVRVLDIEDLA